jgi:hypothetical protein
VLNFSLEIFIVQTFMFIYLFLKMAKQNDEVLYFEFDVEHIIYLPSKFSDYFAILL